WSGKEMPLYVAMDSGVARRKADARRPSTAPAKRMLASHRRRIARDLRRPWPPFPAGAPSWRKSARTWPRPAPGRGVRSRVARDAEEVVEHVEVIVEEAVFHRGELGDRQPLHRRRVVVRAHLGQLAVAEIEVVRVRDRAAALAAVGVVEHGDRAQAA